MTGLDSSVPNKDHVPQLIKTKSSSCVGTAAIALWVSCPATVMTSIGRTPNSLESSLRKAPVFVPGIITGASIRSGILKASSTSPDQSFCSGIPIMNRVCQKGAILIKKSIIHSPGVHTDTFRTALCFGLWDSRLYFMEQSWEVPVHGASFFLSQDYRII